MKKTLFMLMFCLAVAVETMAQDKDISYKVVGEAVDSTTLKGVPYATISIYKSGAEEKPVAMAVTDLNGKFKVESKGDGNYLFTLNFVGCKTVRRQFTVAIGKTVINLGRLLVADDDTELKGVEVVAYKPLVKADIDKLTYDIEQDPESKTTTVIDMLKKVPMVTVDGQDNIKVNGSTSFKVYVNGKPNNMMSNNAKDVLKSMPASSIKKVEVITNPGPKYDAEGVGGILNIITVGNGPEGFTATLTARGTTRGGGSGAFVTTKEGKLTISANYNGSYDDQRTVKYTQKSDILDDEGNAVRSTIQNAESKGYNIWQGGSLEASYEIDTLRLLTGSLNFSRFKYKQRPIMDVDAIASPTGAMLYKYERHSLNDGTYSDISGGIDYQRSFKTPEKLLTLSYRIESGQNASISDVDYPSMESASDWTSYLQQLKKQYVDGNQYSTEHTFQFDFTTPFAKHHTLETGAKYILRQNKAVNDKFDFPSGGEEDRTFDEENSSHYKHRNDIFAAYLGYGLSLDKWSARLGLRYEHTLQDVKYILGRGSDFKKNFDDLVPSAKIGYKFSETMNLSLNYKMRISRPGIWYLNPYLDDSNREQISQGNPNLESEKIHSLDLQLGSFGQKLSYSVSVGGSVTNNSIENVTRVVNDREISGLENPTGNDVYYKTYMNIGKVKSFNFSGYASWNPLKNTRLTANVWGGFGSYSDGQSLKNHGWTASYYIEVQQTIAKTWDISASVYKQTPSIDLQGKNYGYFMHSLTVKKKFLDDRLNVSLSAGNPFKKYFYIKNRQGGKNFSDATNVRIQHQWFALGVSFRLGKLQASVKKAERSIENDDVKQGGKGESSQGSGR